MSDNVGITNAYVCIEVNKNGMIVLAVLTDRDEAMRWKEEPSKDGAVKIVEAAPLNP